MEVQMMIITKILILALIGAIIGWITNILAIKLIFRPLKPINILGYKLQGLIPKRRGEIAKNIGEVVENELISMDDIIDNILTEENINKVKTILKTRITSIIMQKVPSFILTPFKSKIDSYVSDMIDEEGEDLLEELIDRINNNDSTKISFARIVEEKVNSFELDKIEKIIISVANKELKHIEVLGGVLGFLIGVIQGLIMIAI